MLSPHILFTTLSFACPFTGEQSRHIGAVHLIHACTQTVAQI